MRGQSKMPDGGIGFQIKEIPGLSKIASDFVRRHPGEAQIAVTAALEAVSVRFGSARRIDATDVPDALEPFVVKKEARGEMIGVSEAAARIKVSRTTVYDWIEKKRMIGWKATKTGAVIPAEQIVGPGELVKGIEQVLEIIPDARAAWGFLNEVSTFLDEPQRPIDALKAGTVDAVQAAAESHGEAFA